MHTLLAPTLLPKVQVLDSEAILHDYFLCCISRHLSVVGRREVHGGRAKFGIFGDGKEVAQVALAHAFRPGDWRVGYYRGQTPAPGASTSTQVRSFELRQANFDVQSLLPFDRHGLTGRSVQDGYHFLDSPPRTIAAQPHRPAYGTDGDYFSKPNVEDVFEEVYRLPHEAEPARYPLFFAG